MNAMNFIIILFGIFIIYTTLFYNILMIIIAKIMRLKKNLHKNNYSNNLPPISIVLVVRNEEMGVINKLNNLVNLSYKRDKTSIVIVDDFSDDNTASLISNYLVSLKHPTIEMKLLKNNSRGKSGGINTAIEYIRSNFTQTDERLVLFCDARQEIDNEAIHLMAIAFNDIEVGYVSGNIKLEGSSIFSLYWKCEMNLRKNQSDICSTSGGIGPISMARLTLIPRLPQDLILDDVYIPMKILINSGKKAIYVEDAIAHDREYSNKDELNRRYRNLTGNFQLIKYMPELLSIRKNPIFFHYFSHKFMRLLLPFFLFMILWSSIVSCLLYSSLFATIVLLLQTLFYITALITKFLPIPVLKWSYSIASFCLAPLVGLYRFIKKDYRWTGINKNHVR